MTVKEDAVVWYGINNAIISGVCASFFSCTGLLCASWKVESSGWQQFFLLTSTAVAYCNRKLVKNAYSVSRGITLEIENRGVDRIAAQIDGGGIPMLPSSPAQQYVRSRQPEAPEASSVRPVRTPAETPAETPTEPPAEPQATFMAPSFTSSVRSTPAEESAEISSVDLSSASSAIAVLPPPAITNTKKLQVASVEERQAPEQEMEIQLIKALKTYGFRDVSWDGAIVGPTFIRCLLRTNLQLKRIQQCTPDITRILSGFRQIPGGMILIGQEGPHITIDIPRLDREFYPLSKYVEFNPQPITNSMLMAVGIDLKNQLQNINFEDIAHWLVGGAPGGGKSELLRMGILSLCYRYHPDWVSITIGDPKRVTFPEFEKLPWIKNIIRDNADMVEALEDYANCLEVRYKLLESYKVKNIWEYNQKFALTEGIMQFNIFVIDEFAEAVLQGSRNEIENSVRRCAALGRASGDFLVLATQRPSADVVTPLIRSNIQGRIGLSVSSETDSNIIFGGEIPDAKYLVGKGDLLLSARGNTLVRLQAPYITDSDFLPISNWLNPSVAPVEVSHESANNNQANSPEDSPETREISFTDKEKEQLITLSQKLGWLNSSKVISGIWSIRKAKMSADEVRLKFIALAEEGIGHLRGENESLEWSISLEEIVAEENSQQSQLLVQQGSGATEANPQLTSTLS